ncbi:MULTISPECIES: AidA/PixA family protein [unclassified Pseudomonas]|uniref:AidA/PixA family protein n=1 Tax=unclassified Pseudomonas TaxID=196821 RepID=UPI000A1F1BB5|nr:MULTISPECIES: AidA/PixA family protein [unclassified Pseudomonas]
MSSATQTIDVLVNIDVDYLLAHPKNVGGAISMLVTRDAVDSHASGDTGEGGSELWIDVRPGDNIRWRATTLSRNFDRIAVIKDIESGDPHQGGDYKGTMTKPIHFNVPGVVLYLNNAGVGGISKTDVIYTLWQATAQDPGKLWYKITFALYDRDMNQIGSDNTWDPYITVNNQ